MTLRRLLFCLGVGLVVASSTLMPARQEPG